MLAIESTAPRLERPTIVSLPGLPADSPQIISLEKRREAAIAVAAFFEAVSPEIAAPEGQSDEPTPDIGGDRVPPGGVFDVPENRCEPSATFETPFGWVLGKYGTYEEVEDKKTGKLKLAERASSPIWIEGFADPLDGGEPSVKLVSLRGGEEVRATITRTEMRTLRTALEILAPAGFPISDPNKFDVVRYLAAAEDANTGKLPASATASANGWRDDLDGYPTSFVLGRKVVHRDGTASELEISREAGIEEAHIAQYRTRGSESEWKKLLGETVEYPFLMVAPCASAASVLLEPLRTEQGALFEIVADSGLGKSIWLKLAMSVWGANSNRELVNANAKEVALEVHQNFRRHLPLAIDEMKQMSHKTDRTQWIFNLTNGAGRARSNTRIGLQRTLFYKNYTFLSGEAPIAPSSDVSDNGPRVRTFSLNHEDGPFGSRNRGSAARRMKEMLTDNFGFAGRRLVAKLVRQTPTEWDAMRVKRREVEDKLAARGAVAGSGTPINFLERRAGFFAPVYLAAEMLSEIYPDVFPWEKVEENLNHVWDHICLHSAEGFDRTESAMARVREWVARKPALFKMNRDGIGGIEQLGREYSYNVKDSKGLNKGEYGVAIIKTELDKYLTSHEVKFNASDEYLREWLKRGWVLTDNRCRPGRNVRIAGPGVWCVIFTAAALNWGLEDKDVDPENTSDEQADKKRDDPNTEAEDPVPF